MNYYERALELRAQTLSHRRFFHKNAEVGLSMPKATAYVMEKLAEYQIPHTRNVDGHTTEILRMEKQKRVGLPWWKE